MVFGMTFSVTDIARSMNANRRQAEDLLAEGYELGATLAAADADVDEAVIRGRLAELFSQMD